MKLIAPNRRRFLKGATALALAAPSILRPSDAQIAQFSGVPFQQRYPIALDSTKTFPVDQNGNPCFMLGDDAFGLVTTLTKAQIELYLSDRSSRGVNVIWLAPVDNTYSPSPPTDANGDSPFSGGDFLGMSGQTAYWNFVDYVMQRCLAYGITVMFNVAFIGLNSTSGYLTSWDGASTATIQGYASFLATKFGHYPNLIILLGGDADPAITAVYTQANIFAVAFRAADPGHHLITMEASRFTGGSPAPNGGYSSVDALTIALGSVPSWVDINWIYQTQSTVLSGAQRTYTQSLPCLMGETWYELENSTTSLSLRGEAYFSILGGCVLGYIFGNGAIWPFNSPNAGNGVNAGPPTWQSQLSSQGSTDLQRMGALFRSREWQKLVPDIAGTVMTVGAGNGSGCARTGDGQSIIAYVPSSQTVTMDMTKITDSGSQANCNWYDPTNGAVTNIGTFANTGTKNFAPPGNNSLGAPDWVLVIDSHVANLRTPGT